MVVNFYYLSSTFYFQFLSLNDWNNDSHLVLLKEELKNVKFVKNSFNHRCKLLLFKLI